MIMSKVVLEIRFTRHVPKAVLERAVERFVASEKRILKPLRKHDPTAYVRVWYDDMGKHPDVKISDMLPKPNNPFKRMFKRKKAI